MASHDEIYRSQADAYEDMIARQPDLSGTVRAIRDYRGLDVLDLGAGSGRLSRFLAPEAGSLVCTDLSRQMLDVLDRRLEALAVPPGSWTSAQADHRKLPLADASVDLAVSGWSVCYLANTGEPEWERSLAQVMTELTRVLRPGGTIILFETMGTATETPNPPPFLTPYYELLERQYGFAHKWIRTDYRFDSVADAIRRTEFFFGPDVAAAIDRHRWATVPECAGVWWKHLSAAEKI